MHNGVALQGMDSTSNTSRHFASCCYSGSTPWRSLQPQSQRLNPLLGRRNTTRPSKSARKACHVPRYWRTPSQPRNLHSSRTPPLLPWVPYYDNASSGSGSLSHSSPRSSTNTAEVQRLQSRTPSCLGGREVFPPHAGSSPLRYLHGPQTNHLRLPAETWQVLTAAIQPPGVECCWYFRLDHVGVTNLWGVSTINVRLQMMCSFIDTHCKYIACIMRSLRRSSRCY
jgi:hypothetical protein